MDELKSYLAELDAAIIAYVNDGDETQVVALVMKHGLRLSSDPLTRRGTLMKVATGRPSLPMEIRSKAKRWLTENGFHSLDDGDVPV